ncbi:hypothetical protein [Bradyrhizobium sp. 33ap4]|uniref:hypothetical protein n=1 Tax=Bradyrhizobium sp. 33ap4 TaxID=3061630 RepID=UPI0029311F65|nr:hypothetical protein [Bradyrhizobium sp. 33ap4]
MAKQLNEGAFTQWTNPGTRLDAVHQCRKQVEAHLRSLACGGSAKHHPKVGIEIDFEAMSMSLGQ